jgi:uroporphyrinogen-III decarboxylase
MLALIEGGLVPCPLWEGNCTSRLETIREVPEGKACYAFESTDLIKAKEILRGRVCIRGGMPISMLVTGTPDDAKRQTRKLIETMGREGGYIIDASTGLDDAKPENVRAMFDCARE